MSIDKGNSKAMFDFWYNLSEGLYEQQRKNLKFFFQWP
jgi:hypothetical protein